MVPFAPSRQPSPQNDCRESPIQQQMAEPPRTPHRTIQPIHSQKTTEILNLDLR